MDLPQDPLRNILSHSPQDPASVTQFRGISKKFDKAFIEYNKPIYNVINRLSSLLDTLANESLSEMQTQQIISNITKIRDDPKVAFNEIYVFKWPQIINTWYQKMARNNSNYDKIFQIRNAFYLLPLYESDHDQEDAAIERATRANHIWTVPNNTEDEIVLFVATSHAIAIHLMHGTHTTIKDPQIEILKLIYNHLWETDPRLPAFEAVTHLMENAEFDQLRATHKQQLLILTQDYGLIILHPKHTHANFNNISFEMLLNVYEYLQMYYDTPDIDYDQLNAKFVIKVLQSMDKSQLRNCVDEQTEEFADFMSMLHRIVRALIVDDPNNMMQSLLSELKRLDALNMLASDYELVELGTAYGLDCPDPYIQFISRILTIIMDPNGSQDHNITQQRSKVIAFSALLWLHNDHSDSIIKMNELASVQLFDLSTLRQLVSIYNTCRLLRDHQQFLVYSVVNLCVQTQDWDFTDIWNLDWMQQICNDYDLVREAIIKWQSELNSNTPI